MWWSAPVCVCAFVVLFAGAADSLRAGQAAPAPAPPAQATQLGDAAKDTEKGAAILAEARKALGGEDRIKALQRLELKGTVRRGAPQQNINLEGDLEILIELPNKFRRNESLSIGGGGQAVDLIQAMNGTEVWDETKFAANLGGGGDGGDGGDRGGGGGFRGFPGGGRQGQGQQQGNLPPGVDPAQLQQRLQQAQLRTRQTEVARVLLALLATADTPVAWIGTAKAPEGTADVLEITTVDNTQTRIFIESNTHMPLMMSWVGFPQDPIAQLVGQRGGGRGRGGRGGNFQGGNFQGNQQGGQQGRQGQQGQGQQGQQGQAVGRGGRGNEPATLQMFLSDYRTVNGIKLPHLVTRGANGEITEEWIVKNYRINPNFRANTFTQ